MGASMSTAVGWAVIISVAGFFAYREWDMNQRRLAQKNAGQRLRDDQRNALQTRKDIKEKEKDGKVRRQRVTENTSGTQDKAAKETLASVAKSEAPKAGPNKKSPVAAASYSSDDGEVDNREFARQLSSVKQGTKFTAKSKEEVRQKSVKQSRAEEVPRPVAAAAPEEPKVSAPSSTAGIDADDDQSSIASPVVSAVQAAGDVSDMLEKPASGPSVLRLTDTEEKSKSKSRSAKTPEPAETKKQRQNRKKAEAAKAAREEAEADRKVRLEAQRRLVRQTEGRAAKDGSGFMAAQAKGNVWTGGNGVNNATTNGPMPIQPLDTFDADKPVDTPAPAAAAKPQAKTAAPAAKAGSGGAQSDSWMSSLPSEEEQIQMLRDEESWSTVTKVRKSKKKKTAGDSPAESTDEATSQKAEAPKPKPEVAAAPSTSLPVKTENQRPNKSFTQKSSFAALNTDGAADLEEEEEEWDV